MMIDLRINLSILVVALLVCDTSAARPQNSAKTISPRFEIVRPLLDSQVRNAIALADLNNDQWPDLVVGSGAHRLGDDASSLASSYIGGRTTQPAKKHYQVSIHLNQSNSEQVSLGKASMQVPLSASDLAVPPG
ncbi:MAG: hypothetical protein AAGA30_00265 [Planctomycetota bacterium]